MPIGVQFPRFRQTYSTLLTLRLMLLVIAIVAECSDNSLSLGHASHPKKDVERAHVRGSHKVEKPGTTAQQFDKWRMIFRVRRVKARN